MIKNEKEKEQEIITDKRHHSLASRMSQKEGGHERGRAAMDTDGIIIRAERTQPKEHKNKDKRPGIKRRVVLDVTAE